MCEIKQMYINAFEGTPGKTSDICDKILCRKG
jgi:acetaldehyde dehydrogenase/alcohol dehydrogenase